MVFEYILKKKGLNPATDMNINQSIDFGSTAAAFSGGQGDFTVEFEPSATALEKEGGWLRGGIPGGGFRLRSVHILQCGKPVTFEKNPQVIQKFTNAFQKGVLYVNSHTPEEIAKVIQPQFKENDLDTITTIVRRYQEQNTWKENLIFEKDSFELLQDILEEAGELENRAEYDKLVTTEFAKKAIDERSKNKKRVSKVLHGF